MFGIYVEKLWECKLEEVPRNLHLLLIAADNSEAVVMNFTLRNLALKAFFLLCLMGL